ISVFQLLLDLLAQLGKARFKRFVAERVYFGFACVDGRDDRLQFFDVALVLGADKAGHDAVEYLGYFPWVFFLFPARFFPRAATAAEMLKYQSSYSNWLEGLAPRNRARGSA